MGSTTNIMRITEYLNKRNRELACLYSVDAELRLGGIPGEGFRVVTTHLINGLDLPKTASAYILLDGMEYTARPIRKKGAATTLSTDIIIAGAKRGAVEIYLKEKRPFSKEETMLVKEVALRISDILERLELAAESKWYAGGLKQLVEEKTQELEKSKKQYEDFFNESPVPMLFSALNGDIKKANREFYRLLRYPEDGSVHLNFVRDGLYEDPAVRSVLFEKLRRDGYVESLEITLLSSDGEPIPVIASYIIIDVDGVPCVESVYKDIRVRKELERRLMEQNENLEKSICERTIDLEIQNKELINLAQKLKENTIRMEALFQAITDTVVFIDDDFNIIMTNQQNIGNEGKCYERVFNLEVPCEDCLIKRVFEEKSPVSLERVIDGEHCLLRAFPVHDAHNQVIGALEFSRDITKEKNMEQQLLQADKLASLGQLVSGIAHEINNPNTFIRGNLVIVQEVLNDIIPILDRAYDSHPDLKIARLNYEMFRQSIPILADDMVQGANRIKGIVDGLRKFAKRDEGLLNETVDINAITEACMRLVGNQVHRTADMETDFDLDLPLITGNTQKLQQVIVNILINASQAMDGQRGTIQISTSRHSNDEIILKVTDNGKGMDEKTMKQLFDPFFTTKRNRGGTGLGLSIAYGIIKEHKGRIEVESKTGSGTTFSIYLPAGGEGA